jgi:hypothetical protein
MKEFKLSEQLYLGSALDQLTVRLLLAYMVLTCGELPFSV